MQIPILAGIYTDEVADFRSAYPINLMPVPLNNGISQGYLRPADGIIHQGTGPGITRASINWNDVLYRVMGTKLCSIDDFGTVTVLADVGGVGQCVMDYSFDYLAIMSGGNLFYWDGTTLTKVTDPDLGVVVDFIWIDGYFLCTDGEFIVVTDIADPFSVNPLNYASSEIDPDPIKAVLKLRNETFAINRYTIEVFDNVGGNGFPFQRIKGAQIQKGAIGTFCACVAAENIAFLGSGRNESPAVFLGSNANTQKISTREIDEVLAKFTESELAESYLEVRNTKSQIHLWVHLPDRTCVFDFGATLIAGEPVWFTLISGTSGLATYRAKDLAWCYNKWNVGDISTSKIGYLTDTVGSQWGELTRWEFGTTIIYNESRGAIFYELELVCLTGRVEFGEDPRISTSYSEDGVTWSQDKYIRSGIFGDRAKRLVWFKQGSMNNWRIQRFRGDSQSFISIARLEARLEPLAV